MIFPCITSSITDQTNPFFMVKALILQILIWFALPAIAAGEPANLAERAKHRLEQHAQKLMTTVAGSRFTVRITPLPKKIQSRFCAFHPVIKLLDTTRAGPQRMQIICKGTPYWSFYMKGHIDIYVDVLVSRRPFNKGDQPLPADLILQEKNISQLRRGYVTQFQQLDNLEVARKIKAGEVITPSMFNAEQIIKRNDRITITAKGGHSGHRGFTISMPGKALESGTVQQQIRVRNLSSGKIIRARIISSSEVMVQ